MTGGTIPDNDIAINLTTALKNYLRGSRCRVNMADAIGVSEGVFYYPDVMVSCDNRDRQAVIYIQYPCLIAELLSPSTEGYERGRKFTQYRRIQTLKEYVLIDAEKISVECFRLNEQSFWEVHPDAEGDELQIRSVDFCFPISLVYEDVNFLT